jgi:Glycoside Hydrolase Family 113
MARRIGTIAVFSLAALANCYLGLLIAHLLWSAPQLLVAAVSDAEVVAFGRIGSLSLVPNLYVLQPTDAPPLAFAAYAAGAIAVAVVLLAACVRFVDSFGGWFRLSLVYLAFWTNLLLAAAAVGFATRGLGPLAALTAMLGATPRIAGRWILAAAVVIVGCLCVTRLLQSLAGGLGAPAQRAWRLTLWFLLPVAVISASLSAATWRFGRMQPLGGAMPLLLAAAVLLAATLPALATSRFQRQGNPFRPTIRGAIVTVTTGTFALAAMAAYPGMTRHATQPEFDSVTSQHWEISFEQGAFSPAERQSWAEAADRRLEEYSHRLGIPLDGARLRSGVYLSTKNKRAVTRERRDDQPFTLRADALTLDQLLSPERTPEDPRGEPLLLMAHAWGPPASQSVADAIARYAIGSFLSRSLGGYARQISCEEQPYPLADVLGVSPRYISPLVRDAMGGAWIESLAEAHGIDVLPRIYRAIPAEEGSETIAGALGTSWNEVEAAWQSVLARSDARCESPARSAGAPTAGVENGVSFSHEIGGDWGYGSDSAQRELEKIRGIGANSVAIMPYAFTRAPEETSIRFRTDETDARVIRTIEQARHAGLGVLLKPHLWGRGFTGDIRFASDEDFQLWWESYRSWLLHFARMAELYDVELLALGNELGGLTVHEQAWRDLIRDVRRIYRGKLTYASHWSGEFEQVAFWDALDYIGVNAYFPLAAPGETPRSDSARVAAIRSRLAAVAARFGKPVLFTEVGFPSTENAAVGPWADGGGAIDLQLQKRCYEVIFESFWREPWFAGGYWWKWPSHGRGGPYDGSHPPNGKPAMEVLRRWFLDDGRVDPSDSPSEDTRSRGR